MNQAVRGNAEFDHLNIELSPAEEAAHDRIMDSGRGIDSHDALTEVLQSRRKMAEVTGPIAVQQTVEVSNAKTPAERPHPYRGGGRGLHQKSDSEVGPFALEETGIVVRTPEQEAQVAALRQAAEMDFAASLIAQGYTRIEVDARLRARREKRERELW